MICVPIEKIRPLHEPRQNPEKIAELTASMRASNGWGQHQRPLLVEAWNGKYFAWTGSNRLLAARLADLREIPVVLVDVDALRRVGPYSVDATTGSFAAAFDSDEERLKALETVGDVGGADLMRQELAHRAAARGAGSS